MSVDLSNYVEEAAPRFWSKVDKTDSCWLWTGAIHANGYGQIHLRLGPGQYKSALAHRYAYELLTGPIPEGMQIDHLCRTRACVNPDHLEAVTLRENLRRGRGAEVTRARWRSQTHCKRGHPLTGDHVYVVPTTGSRQCLLCVQLRRGNVSA